MLAHLKFGLRTGSLEVLVWALLPTFFIAFLSLQPFPSAYSGIKISNIHLVYRKRLKSISDVDSVLPLGHVGEDDPTLKGPSSSGDSYTDKGHGSRFNVANLLPGGVKVDHLKELRAAAKILDEIREDNGHIATESLKLTEMKLRLSLAKSIDEMVGTLGTDEEGLKAMSRLVEERVLEELLTLGTGEKEQIALSEWPNNQKQNFFVEVVRLANRKSPITLAFLLRLLIKDESSNVEPEHVVSIATIFSQLAYLVDKSNNTLLKINSMQLKLHGLTDEGLVAQEKLNLAVTARTMRHARDEFSYVAESCLIEETKKRPDQAAGVSIVVKNRIAKRAHS